MNVGKLNWILLLCLISLFSCDLGLDDPDQDEDDLATLVAGEYEALITGDLFLGVTSLSVSKNNASEINIAINPATGYPSFNARLARTTTDNIGFIIDPQTAGSYTVRGSFLDGSDFNGGYIFETASDPAELICLAIFEQGGIVDTVAVIASPADGDLNTCLNGIQDGDEMGVDCGGSCSPCEAPAFPLSLDTLLTVSSSNNIFAFDVSGSEILVGSRNSLGTTTHYSSNGGTTWSESATSLSLNDVILWNDTAALASNSNGLLYISDKSFQQWDVFFDQNSGGVTVTPEGRLLGSDFYFDNITDGWQEMTFDAFLNEQNPASENIYAFPSANVTYRLDRNVGNGDYYFNKSTDRGVTWANVYTFTQLNDPRQLFFVSEDEGYLVSTFDVLKTEDGGESWGIIEFAEEQSPYVMYIHNEKGILMDLFPVVSQDGGDTWARIEAADGINDLVLSTPSGTFEADAIGIGSSFYYNGFQDLIILDMNEL